MNGAHWFGLLFAGLLVLSCTQQPFAVSAGKKSSTSLRINRYRQDLMSYPGVAWTAGDNGTFGELRDSVDLLQREMNRAYDAIFGMVLRIAEIEEKMALVKPDRRSKIDLRFWLESSCRFCGRHHVFASSPDTGNDSLVPVNEAQTAADGENAGILQLQGPIAPEYNPRVASPSRGVPVTKNGTLNDDDDDSSDEKANPRPGWRGHREKRASPPVRYDSNITIVTDGSQGDVNSSRFRPSVVGVVVTTNISIGNFENATSGRLAVSENETTTTVASAGNRTLTETASTGEGHPPGVAGNSTKKPETERVGNSTRKPETERVGNSTKKPETEWVGNSTKKPETERVGNSTRKPETEVDVGRRPGNSSANVSTTEMSAPMNLTDSEVSDGGNTTAANRTSGFSVNATVDAWSSNSSSSSNATAEGGGDDDVGEMSGELPEGWAVDNNATLVNNGSLAKNYTLAAAENVTAAVEGVTGQQQQDGGGSGDPWEDHRLYHHRHRGRRPHHRHHHDHHHHRPPGRGQQHLQKLYDRLEKFIQSP